MTAHETGFSTSACSRSADRPRRVLLYQILEPFLGPLAWAIFLGFLLQPLQARLTKWMRGRASISAFALTILVLVLFLGPMTALAISFARQATDLAGRLQVWISEQQGRTLSNLGDMPVVGTALDWLDQNAQVSAAHVQTWLVDGSKRLFEQLASLGGTAFLGAVGTVLAFTVMLFLLFFFIRDGRKIAKAAPRSCRSRPTGARNSPTGSLRSRARSCAARC